VVYPLVIWLGAVASTENGPSLSLLFVVVRERCLRWAADTSCSRCRPTFEISRRPHCSRPCWRLPPFRSLTPSFLLCLLDLLEVSLSSIFLCVSLVLCLFFFFFFACAVHVSLCRGVWRHLYGPPPAESNLYLTTPPFFLVTGFFGAEFERVFSRGVLDVGWTFSSAVFELLRREIQFFALVSRVSPALASLLNEVSLQRSGFFLLRMLSDGLCSVF